jgi:hypothetical protein
MKIPTTFAEKVEKVKGWLKSPRAKPEVARLTLKICDGDGAVARKVYEFAITKFYQENVK